MIADLATRGRELIRSWLGRPVLDISTDAADVESVTIRYLTFILLPAWLIPGIADYVMHRRTRIQGADADADGVGGSAIRRGRTPGRGACGCASGGGHGPTWRRSDSQ